VKFLGFLEYLYARIVVQVWSMRPDLRLESIRRFQAIESDGTWHLFQVLRMTHATEERAKIFQHILEEDSHADLFHDVFQSEARVPFQPKAFTREDLVVNSSETWKSMLFVHVGEVSATRRFKKLQKALCAVKPDDLLGAALGRIARDEEGHISLTEQLARQLQVQKGVLRRELLFIHLNRISNSLTQFTLWLANAAGIALLICGYWLLGIFGMRAARKRLAGNFVLVDNNEVKSFST
jgi:hypothetical protein